MKKLLLGLTLIASMSSFAKTITCGIEEATPTANGNFVYEMIIENQVINNDTLVKEIEGVSISMSFEIDGYQIVATLPSGVKVETGANIDDNGANLDINLLNGKSIGVRCN